MPSGLDIAGLLDSCSSSDVQVIRVENLTNDLSLKFSKLRKQIVLGIGNLIHV